MKVLSLAFKEYLLSLDSQSLSNTCQQFVERWKTKIDIRYSQDNLKTKAIKHNASRDKKGFKEQTSEKKGEEGPRFQALTESSKQKKRHNENRPGED
mmetsp:Transcript_3286/g.3271  ORF Transcript_3286/g.3271 Transcript_3286/m.3271 type:complete len:97 (-) Transcript_3286:1522-1812(-)